MTEIDEIPQLEQALGEATIEHPDVVAWFAEAKRLFDEAEERFEAGRVLSALSSLAAVPPLHHMLVERCFEMLMTSDSAEQVVHEAPIGMYL